MQHWGWDRGAGSHTPQGKLDPAHVDWRPVVAPDTSKYTRTSYVRYARMMNNLSTYHNQTREFECVPAARWLRYVFHLLTLSLHFAYRPKPGDSMQLIEELEEVILAVRILLLRSQPH